MKGLDYLVNMEDAELAQSCVSLNIADKNVLRIDTARLDV